MQEYNYHLIRINSNFSPFVVKCFISLEDLIKWFYGSNECTHWYENSHFIWYNTKEIKIGKLK